MEIPVLIIPMNGSGYRAKVGDPFALTAEGTTAEEAVQNLRGQIAALQTSGATVVSLELSSVDQPWAKFAGTWSNDDPRIDEWREAVEEYRRQMDEDPNVQ